MSKAAVAATLLRNQIRKDRWPQDGMLPAVRGLALQLKISVPTLLSALAILKREGILEDTPAGARYKVAGWNRIAEPIADAPEKSKFLRVARDIKDRLLIGDLSELGTLPSLKELQAHYHCTYRTMSKAVIYLQDRFALLEERSRSYRLKPSSFSDARLSHIYLVGSPAVSRSYSTLFPSVVKALEEEILREGWGRPVWYMPQRPGKEGPPADHQVACFLHIEHGHTKGWKAFFEKKAQIPLIRLDFDEMFRGSYPRHRFFLSLTPSNRKAGSDVARYLWELGHRHIAFFSHVRLNSGHRWLGYRLAGLREFFASGPKFEGPKSEGRLETFFLEAESVGAPSRVLSGLHEADTKLAEEGLLDRLWARQKLRGALDLETLRHVATNMRPLFEAAWERSSATAWVCVNDDLAALAKTFLLGRGIRMPRDISLLGFDNSAYAVESDLTSFDFRWEHHARLAIRCLKSPHLAKRDSYGAVLSPGLLAIRGSTGKPQAG